MAKKPSNPKKASKKKPDPFKQVAGTHPLKKGKPSVKLADPAALEGSVAGYGEPIPDDKAKKFTHKEQLFILNYVANWFNGAKAARDAGYSEDSARSIASENLTKPHIKAEIDRLVSERLMSKEETIMRFSDMARGSLNDYLHVVKKAHTPTVKKSLHVLIRALNDRIDDQAKFVARANIQDKTRLESFAGNLLRWNEQIIEYEIELERNPGAYRLEQGEEVLIDAVELDLVKLAQDKERGLIKSLTPVEGGFKVELYAADAALQNIGKYHGIFEKDNVRLNFNSVPLSADEIKRISETLENDF